MSELSQSEIQRRLNTLEAFHRVTARSGAGATVIITVGVPVVAGTETDGDLAYDSTNGNLYVFDNNSFNLSAEQIHFGYASDVQNANDQGLVTNASDVTSFSMNPSVNGVPLPWQGQFIGSTAPTAVTQYVWTNVKGDSISVTQTSGAAAGDTSQVTFESTDVNVANVVTTIQPGRPGLAATKVFRIDALTPSLPADTPSTPPSGWTIIPTLVGIGTRSVQEGGNITFTTTPLVTTDVTIASGFPASFLEPSVTTRNTIKFNNNSGRSGATLETPDNATWDLFVSNNGLTLAQKVAEFAVLLNGIATSGISVEVDGDSLIIYSKSYTTNLSSAITIASAPDNDFGASAIVVRQSLSTKLWSVAGNRETTASNYNWTELLLESGAEGADGIIQDWVTLTAYTAGDLVQSNNTQWRAIADIPDTNTTAPAEGTGNWSELITESQAVDDLNIVGSLLKLEKNGTAVGTGITLPAKYTDLEAQAAVDVSNTNTTLTFTDKLGVVKNWTPVQPGTGEANVQVNWNVTDTGSDAFILNKPTTITSGQASSISNNNTKVSFTNARARDAVAISATGNTLTFTDASDDVKTWSPAGTGAVNVQSNWTENDSDEDSFI